MFLKHLHVKGEEERKLHYKQNYCSKITFPELHQIKETKK